MRPVERIDNFLEKVNWSELGKKWNTDLSFLDKSTEFNTSPYNNLKEAWKDNPDQRIGQLLINLGLIDDSMEKWTIEDSTILIDQGIPPEECLYWTSIYDEKSEELDEPITRKVSTLKEEHINRIINYMHEHKGRVSAEMAQAFHNMLTKFKNKSAESQTAV